jgi:hypothetical protein
MSRTRSLFTRKFWLDTFERSVATFAEAAVGAYSIDLVRNAVTADDFSSLWWTGAGVLATTALAVLKAIGAAAKNDTDSASVSSTIANS